LGVCINPDSIWRLFSASIVVRCWIAFLSASSKKMTRVIIYQVSVRNDEELSESEAELDEESNSIALTCL